MRLTVVGSADAFNAAGRGHSCYLLEELGTGPIMVDFGASAPMNLKRMGKKLIDIKGLAITHLHGDHVSGLPFLKLDGMFMAARGAALPITGPRGTTAKLKALEDEFYRDLSTHPAAFEMDVTELEPGDRSTLLGVQVEAFAASHMDPPEQALCLRLTGPDGTVVAFSGDTEPCEGLIEAARGADLLVAECTAMRPPAGRHCTWEDWQRLVLEIDARRLLLTHLNAEVRETAPTLEEPSNIAISFAEDGDVVSF